MLLHACLFDPLPGERPILFPCKKHPPFFLPSSSSSSWPLLLLISLLALDRFLSYETNIILYIHWYLHMLQLVSLMLYCLDIAYILPLDLESTMFSACFFHMFSLLYPVSLNNFFKSCLAFSILVHHNPIPGMKIPTASFCSINLASLQYEWKQCFWPPFTLWKCPFFSRLVWFLLLLSLISLLDIDNLLSYKNGRMLYMSRYLHALWLVVLFLYYTDVVYISPLDSKTMHFSLVFFIFFCLYTIFLWITFTTLV